MNDQTNFPGNEPLSPPDTPSASKSPAWLKVIGIVVLACFALVAGLGLIFGRDLLAMVHENRGEMYYNDGDLDRALGEFEKAIELNPEYVRAYDFCGSIHAQNGDLDHAIADYDKAIQLQPDFAGAYYNRGLVQDQETF